MPHAFRTHRGCVLVALALSVATVLGPAAGPAFGASQGPSHNKIPTQVIARVEALQRVMGYLTISPTSGPAGTTIAYTGHCGFPAVTLTWALAQGNETDGFFAVYFGGVTQPLAPSPSGAFSVQLTVPAVSPITNFDILPGSYVAFATCDLTLPTRRDLVPQPFTVTG